MQRKTVERARKPGVTAVSGVPAAANEHRSAFVDFLRSASVVSIIVLHVTLTNANQQPRGLESLYYKLAAVLGSIFTNETLVFVSLLLALPRLREVEFGSFLKSRFVRIGVPFIGFTIFYVALDAASARQGVIFKFPPLQAGALLLIAGLGKYHLHFLPTLLFLVAISPLFLRSYPLYVVLIALLIGDAVRFMTEYFVLTETPAGAITAAQLLLLHAGKVAAYFPFGLLAQWLLNNDTAIHRWREQRPQIQYLLLLLLLGIVAVDMSVTALPAVSPDGRLGFAVFLQEILGTLLIVNGIFLAAVWSSGWRRRGIVDAVYGEFYFRAFLVLMIHPVFLQLFQWLVPIRQADIFQNMLCVVFVLSVSWAAAGILMAIADRLFRTRAATDRVGPGTTPG